MMRISALFVTGATAVRIGDQALLGADCRTYSYASEIKYFTDCIVPMAEDLINDHGSPEAGTTCDSLEPGPNKMKACLITKLTSLLNDDELMGSDCASLAPGAGKDQCVEEKKEKAQDLLDYLKPSMPGSDCASLAPGAGKDKCERHKEIESALQTLAADVQEDLQGCDGPSENQVLCVKSKLQQQLEKYVLMHPGIAGDLDSLKTEIATEFPGVQQDTVNDLLDELSAEITKAQDGEDLDTARLAELANQVSSAMIGDKL